MEKIINYIKNNFGYFVLGLIILFIVVVNAIAGYTILKSLWEIKEDIIQTVAIILSSIGAYTVYKFFKQPEQNK
jgi:hypothetical protein